MRIQPSKNTQAVDEALAMHELDEHARANGYASMLREDGSLKGPRGIVNARRLGLSKHPRKRWPKPRDRRAAQVALCSRRRLETP